MKSALLGVGIGIVIALVSVTGSCSYSHPSDQYTCSKTSDCAAFQGRVCSDGFCVVEGSIDAPKADAPKGDGASCPSACTSCNVAQHTCTIDCSIATGSVSCANKVICPAGYKCDVQCKTDNSCRNGVDCTAAQSCTVECSGRQSCQNVECGPGPCDTSCSGPSSCRNIMCNASCACDVTCTGSASCQSGVTCTSPVCDMGSGCSSLLPSCHSC